MVAELGKLPLAMVVAAAHNLVLEVLTARVLLH
jgi:hypothetical protein